MVRDRFILDGRTVQILANGEPVKATGFVTDASVSTVVIHRVESGKDQGLWFVTPLEGHYFPPRAALNFLSGIRWEYLSEAQDAARAQWPNAVIAVEST